MSDIHPVLQRINLLGIVPVIAIDRSEDAVPLARALVDGGLPCAEVTFRTAAAERSIEAIAKAYPDMALGAGTVLSVEQVKKAVGAGARFIVSPGLNPEVVTYCVSNNIPVTPGVITPSEIEHAMRLGLSVMKFFPAEASGGVNFLNAVSAPYKTVKFIPTGGIDENNLLTYLKLPSTFACGGSWMVKKDMIAAGQFDTIRAMTSAAVAKMLGFTLKHVGINTPNVESSLGHADELSKILGMTVKEGNSSTFVGSEFEFTKKKGHGEHGHLAVGTHFIGRAVKYLESRGFRMNEASKVEKNGSLVAVYFEKEVSGFALHLLQM